MRDVHVDGGAVGNEAIKLQGGDEGHAGGGVRAEVAVDVGRPGWERLPDGPGGAVPLTFSLPRPGVLPFKSFTVLLVPNGELGCLLETAGERGAPWEEVAGIFGEVCKRRRWELGGETV